MGSQRCLLLMFLSFLVLGFVSSHYISNEAIEVHEKVAGRSLKEQPQKICKAAENLNYSLLTSQCKGPNYTPERCCVPMKQLLCPIYKQFNDPTSFCAETFFCNVNYYGKYPLGLFSGMCKEGKEGLDCNKILGII